MPPARKLVSILENDRPRQCPLCRTPVTAMLNSLFFTSFGDQEGRIPSFFRLTG